MADSHEITMNSTEYAKHLALTLSDAVFEQLVRERIRMAYEPIIKSNEFSDSYSSVTFSWSANSTAKWSTQIGENYDKHVNLKGEIFSQTFADCVSTVEKQRRNKLVLLLEDQSSVTVEEPVSAESPAPL